MKQPSQAKSTASATAPPPHTDSLPSAGLSSVIRPLLATHVPQSSLQFYVDAMAPAKSASPITAPSGTIRRSSSDSTWDYKLVPGSSPQFQKYDIYAYHYFDPNDGNNKTVNVTDTYVTQTFGGYTSDPGGQIYVNGNVVIGGDSNATIDPNR